MTVPGDDAPRDVIFTFAYASWKTAVDRGMCFSEDRLAEALLEHPQVRRLMVVETPRSLPIKLVQGGPAPAAALPGHRARDALQPGPRAPHGPARLCRP